nr:MAG TPA: hypothetical protein [Caudoviricetes sp.]
MKKVIKCLGMYFLMFLGVIVTFGLYYLLKKR